MRDYTLVSAIMFLVAGAFGAIVKDCVEDGKLILPKVEDGALVLGFLGGAVIGALAGIALDGDFATAALAGYAGKGVIENLVARGKGERDAEKDR